VPYTADHAAAPRFVALGLEEVLYKPAPPERIQQLLHHTLTTPVRATGETSRPPLYDFIQEQSARVLRQASTGHGPMRVLLLTGSEMHFQGLRVLIEQTGNEVVRRGSDGSNLFRISVIVCTPDSLDEARALADRTQIPLLIYGASTDRRSMNLLQEELNIVVEPVSTDTLSLALRIVAFGRGPDRRSSDRRRYRRRQHRPEFPSPHRRLGDHTGLCRLALGATAPGDTTGGLVIHPEEA
jgi:hypothetical protein